MTPQVNISNATSRGVIASLRSPCAQSATLKRGYSQASPRHLGQVLVFPDVTEPVIAPANGTILSINSTVNTDWDHAAGELDTHKTLEIKIDHGGYVSTTIHGLATVSVVIGQYVTRGDELGTVKTTEIFFQLFYRNSPLDPASFSTFFRGYDGGRVPGKARKLRAGPDFVDRDDSDTVSYQSGGIRYFVDKNCAKTPLLINIDFNGSGDKSGYAQTGSTASDFWNVYQAQTFVTSSGTLCFAVLNPSVEQVSDAIDSAGNALALFNGSLFQVIFIGTGTESASSNSSFLIGSTETIPEVDTVAGVLSFISGDTTETAVTSTVADYGTNTTSFFSGSLFESTVYAFGTIASVPNVYTEYGSMSISWASGSLFDATIYANGTSGTDANIVYDAGSNSVSFISGGTETILLPTSYTNDSAGTISYFSGSIHQF